MSTARQSQTITPGMIVGLAWAHRHARWALVRVDGDYVELVTTVTRKRLRARLADVVWSGETRAEVKSARRIRNLFDRD